MKTKNSLIVTAIFSLLFGVCNAQWVRVQGNIPFNVTVRCFASSPNGEGGTNLFAGTEGAGVFLSTNDGLSWIEVNAGLTDYRVFSLAVFGSNLYAGTYGAGIFRSTNNGISWSAVNSGFTGSEVYSLAVSGSNLFAGAFFGGVYR